MIKRSVAGNRISFENILAVALFLWPLMLLLPAGRLYRTKVAGVQVDESVI
jgi:hypothetical protein